MLLDLVYRMVLVLDTSDLDTQGTPANIMGFKTVPSVLKLTTAQNTRLEDKPNMFFKHTATNHNMLLGRSKKMYLGFLGKLVVTLG